MAEVIVEKYAKSTKEKETILFKVKKDLMKLKKQGQIYINKPISSIELKTEIDFYHVSHPGRIKTYNTFPMPRRVYLNGKKEGNLPTLIRRYHKKYYGHNDFSKVELHLYITDPFEGIHTVWFTKKKD